MIAIAICALGGSIDAEAPHLARDLAIAVYDARLKLSQPPPMIVARTSDAAVARDLHAKLRARGHDAVAIDESDIAAPFSVRACRFGESAFESDAERFAYGDIALLVRAVQTTRSETTARVTERKLRPAAAIATGGLILSKKVTRDEKRITQDREELLYVFGARRAPWVVAERGTIYSSLENVAASQRENFVRVVEMIRARAPHAAFDERLLAHRAIADRPEITLRAHALYLSITSLPSASKT